LNNPITDLGQRVVQCVADRADRWIDPASARRSVNAIEVSCESVVVMMREPGQSVTPRVPGPIACSIASSTSSVRNRGAGSPAEDAAGVARR
jgi:hypothetical protein